MAEFNIAQGDKLQYSLSDTFETIDDILSSAEITNEMLKRVYVHVPRTIDGKAHSRLIFATIWSVYYQCHC